MLPVKTERSNQVYRGNDGDVMDLHCEIGAFVGGPFDGMRVCQSVWEPSEEEREAIAYGANIKLAVWSCPPPPASVDVTNEVVIRDE